MIENIKTKNSIQEAIIIIIISIVLSFIYNLFSPKSIPLIKEVDQIEYISDQELFQNIHYDSLEHKSVTTKQMLDLINNRNAIILDARNAEAYRKGHIPNAINIPFLDVLNFVDKLQMIPRDTLIVVYCEGVNCELSHHLYEFMRGMNFTRILHYAGGYEEWVKNKLPVEKTD